jgi:hypothetical protein
MTGNSMNESCIFLLHPEKSRLIHAPKRHFCIEQYTSTFLPIPYVSPERILFMDCSTLVEWLEEELEYAKKELEIESGFGVRKIQGKIETYQKILDHIHTQNSKVLGAKRRWMD